MTLKESWNKEKKNHLGDYGDSSEYDIECAFKAGYMAGIRDHSEVVKSYIVEIIKPKLEKERRCGHYRSHTFCGR